MYRIPSFPSSQPGSASVGWVAFLLLLIAGSALTGCFPVEGRVRLDPKYINDQTIYQPTKAHMHDGSVILLENGFRARRDSLFGTGARYGIERALTYEPITVYWKIPLDSIVGLEYIESDVPAGRVPGEILIAASTYVPAGIFLLKVIFGSCPTVYSKEGSELHLEAECFSHSISSMFERPDMDRLDLRDTSAGPLALELRNEALETHYIDRFELGFIDHPRSSQVHSISDEEAIVVSNPVNVSRAKNSEGLDVAHALRFKDGNTYGVDSATAARMFRSGKRDQIDMTVNVAQGQEELALVLRGRNTLQNTVLFYELMMRDQGASVLNWSGTISKNMLAAYRIHQWYQANSGIIISVKDGDIFRERARIRDTGPIAWKTTARVLPLPDHDSTVTIRLSFVPDSWNIDWVEFDSTISEPIKPTFVECLTTNRHQNTLMTDDSAVLAEDDGEYFVSYPGESMDLNFDVPALREEDRTFFVRSKGYYIEWVRPEWVKSREYIHEFDPTEPEYIRKRLAKLWLERKNSFEAEFFNFKVPINVEEMEVKK